MGRRFACAALMPVLLASRTLAGQAAGTFSLQGTVVDGTTDQPIAGALVRSDDQALALRTDADGHFHAELTLLRPGAPDAGEHAGPRGIALTAQKPGYVAAGGNGFPAFNERAVAAPLRLTLMPAARIDGRVYAEGAENLDGIQVVLSCLTASPFGLLSWAARGSATTNSVGEFHFAELRPGHCTVSSAPWTGELNLLPARTEPAKIYPASFLGGSDKLESAEKLDLRYGSRQQVELHLHRVTYFPVSLAVGKTAGLGAEVFSVDGEFGSFVPFAQVDGRLQGWLPNGSHDLLLGEGRGVATAEVHVTVENQPVAAGPVTFSVPVPIPVHVHEQFSKAKPTRSRTSIRPVPADAAGDLEGEGAPRVSVVLTRDKFEARQVLGARPVNNAGDLAIENQLPGTYFFTADVAGGYVAAASSGSLDLLRRPLVLTSGGSVEPIEVTVRDDGASVTGLAAGRSAGQTGVVVSLVAEDGLLLLREAQVAADGSFSLEEVPPGTYLLFAMAMEDRGLAVRDPNFMRRYGSSATRPTLAPDQHVTVTVTVVDASTEVGGMP